jgi:GNAT superfamily N-acetyltransferase
MPAAGRVWVAGPEDLDDVTRLMCAFRDWHGLSAPDDASFRRTLTGLLADPGAAFLLAGAADGPAVAVAQLRFRRAVWVEGLDGELEDLFVQEHARGRGLGALLLDAALEHARAVGGRRLKLDANAANVPAQALYRSRGFASAGADGHDDLLLRLRLDARGG